MARKFQICASLSRETASVRRSGSPSQRSLPQASVHRPIGPRRIPRGHVHRVGHVRHRHLGLGPARKDGAKIRWLTRPCSSLTPFMRAQVRAARYAMLNGSSAVVRIDPPESHQLLGREAAAARVVGAVVLEQRPRERVERGGDRRVRREHVAGPRRPQCREEVRPVGMHERACALDGRERRVALVQVTDVDLDAERLRARASRRCRARSPAAGGARRRRRRAAP